MGTLKLKTYHARSDYKAVGVTTLLMPPGILYGVLDKPHRRWFRYMSLLGHNHYDDVIMGAIASHITSLTIVYSIVYQTQIKESIKAPRHWPLCGELTGEFPAQMASYAENVSISWRHHDEWTLLTWCRLCAVTVYYATGGPFTNMEKLKSQYG